MNDEIQSKRQKLITLLLENGYEPDPRGDMVTTRPQTLPGGKVLTRKFRVRFQEISVRFEVQGLERHPRWNTLPWLRLTSSYYSKIVDLDDGRMRVGSVVIGRIREVEHAG